jgi:hypothetical protein
MLLVAKTALVIAWFSSDYEATVVYSDQEPPMAYSSYVTRCMRSLTELDEKTTYLPNNQPRLHAHYPSICPASTST